MTDQNELDEKTKRELDEIREGLSKIAAEELQPRERRDLSAKGKEHDYTAGTNNNNNKK